MPIHLRLAGFLCMCGSAAAITGCKGGTSAPVQPASPVVSAEDLARRSFERRAVQAVIWGMPAVNFDRMYQAMVHDAKAGEGSNKIVYWSRLFDWKNQTLTPNPDSIYLMPFFNTKDVGPVVLEIPPAGSTAPSPAPSTTAGRRPSKTSVQPASTRAKEASTSSCLRTTKTSFPPATSPCSRTTTRATRCSAPSSRAAARPTSPKPSPTASGSSSTRSRRPPIRLPPSSSTPSTWSTTPPFPGTCATSNRSTASSRPSRG